MCYCRDVCKMSLWSGEYIMNKSIAKFNWISDLIKIPLVGQAPGAKTPNTPYPLMLIKYSLYWTASLQKYKGYTE